ncbi:MAG: shikimate kinase [Bacteroidetes bacterium]|nr:shikimate kinase [Bacteroidota bacterium]
MLIFLVGFMGSGKSTLGKQLARKLNYQYIDQDHYIESKTAMTIADYFSTKGEESFRKLEHETLKELLKLKDTVISTGGGTPCFFNNVELMNAGGLAIYLKLRPEILMSRLKNAQQERPLIKGKSESELLEFIKMKLKEREPYYLKAKCVIESLDLKSDDLLQLVNYHNTDH